MSNIKQQDWAYLAGFLDADGSIYVRVKPNTSYRYGFQISPSVVFFQSSKEKEKIAEIQKIFGAGYLRERKDRIIEWTIGDQKSIRFIMKNTMPFLRLKKKQAQLMLDVLDKKSKIKTKEEFVEVVDRIEEFKTLNYSKKRTNDKEKVLARLKFDLDIKLKKKNLLAP